MKTNTPDFFDTIKTLVSTGPRDGTESFDDRVEMALIAVSSACADANDFDARDQINALIVRLFAN